jgi:branched-chain amino acid transport system ATP-binding protein
VKLLEVEDLRVGFGGHLVLSDVGLEVSESEVVAVVGPNGAGKSVMAKCIAGSLRPWSGDIRWRGKSVLGLTPERRVGQGIGHIPQGRRLFLSLTVKHNIELGAYRLSGRDRRRALHEGFERFPEAQSLQKRRAGTLSGGEQALVAFARAQAGWPSLIVADEPTAHLSVSSLRNLSSSILAAKEEGTSFLLIEQNLHFALRVADSIAVLAGGSAVYWGPADAISHEGLVALMGFRRSGAT